MLRFDNIRLDPSGLRMFRDEVAVEAPPQVVAVLLYLVAQRERVVPRQELLERFWPRAGSGGDAALNTCIRRVRAVLDDDAAAPRYLLTLPRAGYRFLGTLTEPAAANATARPRRRLAVAAAALAAVVVCAVLWGRAALWPPARTVAIAPAQGLCEYVLFPNFNRGLRESLVARVSQALPPGYVMAADQTRADLRAQLSVRQTPQRTVVVLTLVNPGDRRVLWSDEFQAPTDTQDYVPLQRALAERMAAGLLRALPGKT